MSNEIIESIINRLKADQKKLIIDKKDAQKELDSIEEEAKGNFCLTLEFPDMRRCDKIIKNSDVEILKIENEIKFLEGLKKKGSD